MLKIKIVTFQMNIAVFLTAIFVLGCASNSTETNLVSGGFGDFKPVHAEGFSVQTGAEFTVVKVKNPWQAAQNIEFTYVLAKPSILLPDSLLQFKRINTPVKKVICMATGHIGYIDKLQEIGSIRGVSGNYVYNKQVRDSLKAGSIMDAGYDRNINFEAVINIQPDVVFLYGVGAEVTSLIHKFEELKIPVVMVGEYLEKTPLAKAEWIKFFGSFYEKDSLANAYFEKVEQSYNSLVQITKTIEKRPKVVSGLPWNDVWYVPGGKSFAAKFIADAGGNYSWAENESFEAIPLSLEAVMIQADNADIWINAGGAKSLNEILSVDERLKQFGPFKRNNVYNNTKRITEVGGNDYWESGMPDAHLILSDLIRIFHPELLGSECFYYHKLN